nr:serine hydrolase-like protein [Onthophagus taurus]
MAQSSKSQEIEIATPWGQISAKTWGHSINQVVLLLHGLEDNANTFDGLIPLLPQDYYYVSIDLPGHGKSDVLPSLGLPLQGMDYVYVIKMLFDHFAREKYIIIGHSFGAILGMQIGFVYPEKLEKLFILDTLWFQIIKPSEFGNWTRNKFQEFAKIQNQITRNTTVYFTYKQAEDVMTTWRYSNCELTPKATETLLERSIKQVGNDKYRFTRDPKLKSYLCYPLDEQYACEMIKSHNITFKIVVIVTEKAEIFYNEKYPNLVEEYKKVADWFVVKGNHHVHLNEPSVVSNIINQFLDEAYPI